MDDGIGRLIDPERQLMHSRWGFNSPFFSRPFVSSLKFRHSSSLGSALIHWSQAEGAARPLDYRFRLPLTSNLGFGIGSHSVSLIDSRLGQFTVNPSDQSFQIENDCQVDDVSVRTIFSWAKPLTNVRLSTFMSTTNIDRQSAKCHFFLTLQSTRSYGGFAVRFPAGLSWDTWLTVSPSSVELPFVMAFSQPIGRNRFTAASGVLVGPDNQERFRFAYGVSSPETRLQVRVDLSCAAFQLKKWDIEYTAKSDRLKGEVAFTNPTGQKSIAHLGLTWNVTQGLQIGGKVRKSGSDWRFAWNVGFRTGDCE
jgi:hypothetical protein